MLQEHRGLLFALGAGMCTTIGGGCVFFVNSYKRLPLALCMALSSGVMTYVSLIDLFPEAKQNIKEGLSQPPYDTNKAFMDTHSCLPYVITTSCFFCGWVLGTFFEYIIEILIDKWDLEVIHNVPHPSLGTPKNIVSDGLELSSDFSGVSITRHESRHRVKTVQYSKPLQLTPRHNTTFGVKSNEMIILPNPPDLPCQTNMSGTRGTQDILLDEKENPCCKKHYLNCCGLSHDEARLWELQHAEECFRRDGRKVLKMGFFTALTLGLHNLPEGIATFTDSLVNKKAGALAIAIGVHNIPEGFAVSVPLYFGTGKRLPAFFYSVITGLAEPIGALIAWGILGDTKNQLVLGVAFAIISGMMTNIALKELLPLAIKYDPCNEVTSSAFTTGMAIMGVSLIFFRV